VELGGRLVVPAAPGAAAVEADDGALVAAHDHPGRCRGIDPQLVVIVATRRPLDGGEGRPRVGRLEQRYVRDVNDIGILRVHGDPAEVPVAAGDAWVGPGQAPRRPTVVGAV